MLWKLGETAEAWKSVKLLRNKVSTSGLKSAANSVRLYCTLRNIRSQFILSLKMLNFDFLDVIG